LSGSVGQIFPDFAVLNPDYDMAVGLFQDQRAFGEVLAHLAYPIVLAGINAFFSARLKSCPALL